MYITKRLFGLLPGTVVFRQTGEITLASAYDSFHGAYETTDGAYVTPADLIGCECDISNAVSPKEISLDNGRHWLEPQMVLELVDDEIEELDRLWDAIVSAMDDELREAVHAEFSPCSKQEFLAEYLKRAPRDIIVG